jgi:flavin-binding protein dodecin
MLTRSYATAAHRPRAAIRRSLGDTTMSVAKIIEVNSASTKSMEAAVQHGLTKCAETVKNIKGAWVNEIKVVTADDGTVTEWRVNLRVTFIVQ